MNKNYTVTLKTEQEAVIDLDELECIIQQLAAIQNGYGHDYGKCFIQERPDEKIEFVWTKGKDF
jgi:hypothetical protein